MQAIQTKFLCPTNTRGARIKASCAAKSIIIPFDYQAGDYGSHANAANMLALSLNWIKPHYPGLIGGTLPDGSMAWVFKAN